MAKIALSHSRLSTYRSCPRKFKLQYLDKAFPDDSDNPHFVRGNRIHEQLEHFVMWKNAGETFDQPAMTQEAKNAIPILEKIFSSYTSVLPEQKLCIDANWRKVGWFDKRAHLRAILDLVAFKPGRGLICDYKTGKVREYNEYGGQLHLNAAMLFAVEPDIQEVDVAYLFVDHKQTIKVHFHRDQFEEFKNHFETEHTQVNTEADWAPKINQYCKWCPATRTQCEFSKQL